MSADHGRKAPKVVNIRRADGEHNIPVDRLVLMHGNVAETDRSLHLPTNLGIDNAHSLQGVK